MANKILMKTVVRYGVNGCQDAESAGLCCNPCNTKQDATDSSDTIKLSALLGM